MDFHDEGEETRTYKSLKIREGTHANLTRLVAIRTLQQDSPVKFVDVLDELIESALMEEENSFGGRV